MNISKSAGSTLLSAATPTQSFFQDFETNERRRSTLADCENCAKIMDALPEFDFLMSLSDPVDCPPELKDLYSLQAMLEYSDKPICSLPTEPLYHGRTRRNDRGSVRKFGSLCRENHLSSCFQARLQRLSVRKMRFLPTNNSIVRNITFPKV